MHVWISPVGHRERIDLVRIIWSCTRICSALFFSNSRYGYLFSSRFLSRARTLIFFGIFLGENTASDCFFDTLKNTLEIRPIFYSSKVQMNFDNDNWLLTISRFSSNECHETHFKLYSFYRLINNTIINYYNNTIWHLLGNRVEFWYQIFGIFIQFYVDIFYLIIIRIIENRYKTLRILEYKIFLQISSIYRLIDKMLQFFTTIPKLYKLLIISICC